ncbi:MAG: CpaF/VirB11 family protein [Helicobacteraceae bacterium]
MRVLNTHLEKIKKYLNYPNAEELIFNKLFEVKVSLGGDEWAFIKDKHLDDVFYKGFTNQLATLSNQVFDRFNPIMATSIPYTNYRVQAMHESIKVIETAQQNIPTISVRIPAKKEYKIADFIKQTNTKAKAQAKAGVQQASSLEKRIDLILQGDFNVLISGGTSSGKTTLLNAFLKRLWEFKPGKRVVTIEDAKELQVLHENKDQFLVSRTNSGAVKVNYVDMINSCMRLRPDFILLGEVSVENSSTLLRIGNSGHKGMISTIHADSAKDALDALAINLKLSGFNAGDETILKYISQAVDYCIQVSKINGVRRITQILDTKELV